MIERKCLICNKVFKVKPSRIKDGGGKYCSNTCRYNGKKKEHHWNWTGGKHNIRYCKACGKKICLTNSQIKKGMGNFCSYTCSASDRTGIKNPNWRGGGTLKTCKSCGKEFMVRRGSNHQCCSKECISGKYHPNWKGGNTPIIIKIRMSTKYKHWRQQVFIRDNFTCQDCGQRGGYLESHHHKKTFTDILEEVKKNLPLMELYDGAMVYEPLWDIDNGKTLCNKCHNKTKKGRKCV